MSLSKKELLEMKGSAPDMTLAELASMFGRTKSNMHRICIEEGIEHLHGPDDHFKPNTGRAGGQVPVDHKRRLSPDDDQARTVLRECRRQRTLYRNGAVKHLLESAEYPSERAGNEEIDRYY